jgi:hypothetical protein
VAVVDQINARVDPAVKAKYDAAAAAIGVTTSELFRELLDKGMPEVEQRAKLAVAARGQWPNNIPHAAVEQELRSLMISISRTDPLTLQPRDLMGPRGRALLTLLSWVWDQDTASAAEVKAREKIASWLASLNIKATVTAGAKSEADTGHFSPESKPVKPYPRRGT